MWKWAASDSNMESNGAELFSICSPGSFLLPYHRLWPFSEHRSGSVPTQCDTVTG